MFNSIMKILNLRMQHFDYENIISEAQAKTTLRSSSQNYFNADIGFCKHALIIITKKKNKKKIQEILPTIKQTNIVVHFAIIYYRGTICIHTCNIFRK